MSAPGYRIERFDELPKEQTEFLWPPYVPFGAVTLFDGPPGIAKTRLMIDFASRLSRGTDIPAGLMHQSEVRTAALPRGRTLYMTQENAKGDLRQIAEDQGADLKRLHLVALSAGEEGNPLILDLEEGIPRLEETVRTLRPSLVVIDPLMQFIGDARDAHRDNEVRPVMTRLGQLAETHRCSIVCIRHHSKGSKGSGDAINAGLGSIAFVGTARSAIMLVRDPDDPNALVFAHAKSNCGPFGASMQCRVFDLTEYPNGDSLPTSYRAHFEWSGRSDKRADELLVRSDPGLGHSKQGFALAIVSAELRETGWVKVSDVTEHLGRSRISTDTLKLAVRKSESLRWLPARGQKPAVIVDWERRNDLPKELRDRARTARREISKSTGRY